MPTTSNQRKTRAIPKQAFFGGGRTGPAQSWQQPQWTWGSQPSTSESHSIQNWSGGQHTAEQASPYAHPQWQVQPEAVYAATFEPECSGTDSETSSDADSEELPQPVYSSEEEEAAMDLTAAPVTPTQGASA